MANQRSRGDPGRDDDDRPDGWFAYLIYRLFNVIDDSRQSWSSVFKSLLILWGIFVPVLIGVLASKDALADIDWKSINWNLVRDAAVPYPLAVGGVGTLVTVLVVLRRRHRNRHAQQRADAVGGGGRPAPAPNQDQRAGPKIDQQRTERPQRQGGQGQGDGRPRATGDQVVRDQRHQRDRHPRERRQGPPGGGRSEARGHRPKPNGPGGDQNSPRGKRPDPGGD